jgi:hypothetical protein
MRSSRQSSRMRSWASLDSSSLLFRVLVLVMFLVMLLAMEVVRSLIEMEEGVSRVR